MANSANSNPPPTGTGGRRGFSMLPLAIVALALIVGVVLYISLRNQPNYQEEGDLGDEPAPVETST